LTSEFPKGAVVIEHAHCVGGQFKDHHFWMASINGEVEDYNYKQNLINDAKREGKQWVVLRRHKNGTKSIVKQSVVVSNDKR